MKKTSVAASRPPSTPIIRNLDAFVALNLKLNFQKKQLARNRKIVKPMAKVVNSVECIERVITRKLRCAYTHIHTRDPTCYILILIPLKVILYFIYVLCLILMHFVLYYKWIVRIILKFVNKFCNF